MAETTIRTSDAGPPKSWTAFLEVAGTRVTPRLYEDNPYRLLGAPVLASTRELSKRLDQLQLSLELGTTAWDWGFAPEQPPSLDALRRAAQVLKDPRERLIAELFWFWPETYPLEGTDAGMEALQAGSVADAVSFWASKSADESPTALHNLAVYHHLMAIQQELVDPPIPDEDKTAWWGAAMRYWHALVENAPCWKRLRERVAGLADPQVPVETVERFRTAVRDLLPAINAALALKYAEQGNTGASARQVALLGDLQPDSALARRALERGVAPVVRRIDVQIGDAKRAASDPAQGLAAARQLVLQSLPDIQILDTLCGRESAIFEETGSLLVGSALDLLVAYQRTTADNAGCLPLLCFLRTVRPTPETERRVEQTFDVVFENTLRGHETDEPVAEDSGTAPEPGYAKHYRVLREALIPGLLELGLPGTALQKGCDVVSDLLRGVARDACDERDDIEFALHAYQTLLMLPCDESEHLRREEERQGFSRSFFEEKEKELRLEHGPHYLELTRRGLAWNGRTWPVESITALRYGERVDAAGLRQLELGWKAGEEEATLGSENLFFDPEIAPSHFERVLDAFRYFVVPRLATRAVEAVRAGETITIGEAAFRSSGVVLAVKSLWKREHAVPYGSLLCREEPGAISLANSENGRLDVRYSTLDTWNAVLIPYVIAALAPS